MSHDLHTPQSTDGAQPVKTGERRTDGSGSTTAVGHSSETTGVTRRATLAAGIEATLGVSGCLGFGPDGGDGTPAADSATTTPTDSMSPAVEVRLESAPNGV